MSRWQIVGLGWLGQALKVELETTGVAARGTHRGNFTFGRDPLPPAAEDVLFLNTPPLRPLAPAKYVDTVIAAAPRRVLFVSSTSVYGANQGRVTESTVPQPLTESARWLVAVETLLRENLRTALTIIRPGGLIGGDRHPVYPLSRGGITVDAEPVNLIHREDLIGIAIAAAARTEVPLVNAVAPFHPPKAEYYTDWARKVGLPPLVTSAERSLDRTVDSDVLPTVYPEWRCPRLDYL